MTMNFDGCYNAAQLNASPTLFRSEIVMRQATTIVAAFAARHARAQAAPTATPCGQAFSARLS